VYLPLLAAHRWLCAAEGYDYEKRPEAAARSRREFEARVRIAAQSSNALIRAAAARLADQIDRFTRLALKAQGQCRATIETLALMKNPPTVFARQANIAHGPQQVNNGARPSSRAGDQETEPNKLLESPRERMDCGATCAAGAGDQAVAAVGTRHRATKRRG
jgi:hypothetical protein